jgi:hypothetical protein
MTIKEQQTIDDLYRAVREMRACNENNRNELKQMVESMNAKVERKTNPIYFEADIMRVTQQAISESISKALTGYDSPMIKLVKSVIEERSTILQEIISSSFDEVIKTDDFKASIVSGFSHKVARTIISNNDGLFDKVANELKQDAMFKAKMALAVANVVNECLTGKTDERKNN